MNEDTRGKFIERISEDGVRYAIYVPEDVNTNAKNIQNIFDSFSSIMMDLANKGVFEGKASEEFQNKFSQIKGRLSTYVTTVEDFSKEMTHASDTTEDTEKRIQQKAAELPDINI